MSWTDHSATNKHHSLILPLSLQMVFSELTLWCHHSWSVTSRKHLASYSSIVHARANCLHTMDMLWEKFQWILPLSMKPISFQSKTSVVCSVTTALVIDFCPKKLNVFSQNIGKKTNEYLNTAEQIPMNWNVDHVSVLITSWDITSWCSINLLWKEVMEHMSEHTGLISSYQLLITAACANTDGKMKGSHPRAADRCPLVPRHS